MAKKYPHLYHTLRRHVYKNKSVVYFCTDNCEYKASPELLIGKISLCNRCAKPFRHTNYSLKLKLPHCENCHVAKPVEEFDESENVISQNRIESSMAESQVEVPDTTASLKERMQRTIYKTIEIKDDENGDDQEFL